MLVRTYNGKNIHFIRSVELNLRQNPATAGEWWLAYRIQDHIVVITSLLCRLQVQTLPDEAPPMAKINPFSKIAVTFEPVM